MYREVNMKSYVTFGSLTFFLCHTMQRWWPVLLPGTCHSMYLLTACLPTASPALSLFTLGLTAHWQEEWLDWQLKVSACPCSVGPPLCVSVCVWAQSLPRTHISHSVVTGRLFYIFTAQKWEGKVLKATFTQ